MSPVKVVTPFCECCRTYHGPEKLCGSDLLQQVYCRKCERTHYEKDPCDFSPETAEVKHKCKFVYRDNRAHRIICEIEAYTLEEADNEFMRQFMQDPGESPHISIAVEEWGNKKFIVL